MSAKNKLINHRRDLGRPTGWTEKFRHLRPLGYSAHISQLEEVYIISVLAPCPDV